jgi:hypothetical protein
MQLCTTLSTSMYWEGTVAERVSVRGVCAESRWEELPALPAAGWAMSAVELDNSLYALGGWSSSYLDTVQKLSLDSLT